ncbi:hypothetical protein B296_00036632 [Ensete ventricosum]|uniref:Uncharacterized protein n=1 Tax=Ensete ventricosum TaxID=4639 RepID=A0A426Z234_ENSVE|nr:hypothetical protein B296_00036632 [Ensete ventricosum]
MGVRGFFVGALGMCRLLGTLTGRAKIQAVTSCRRRVAYPRSGDLIWLTFMGETFFFVSASFRSSVGYLFVDTCTKAMVSRVGGVGGQVPP